MTRCAEDDGTWNVPDQCSTAYAFPGESVGQDAAICESRQTELTDLACAELCAAVTDSQNGESFGDDCEGL